MVCLYPNGQFRFIGVASFSSRPVYFYRTHSDPANATDTDTVRVTVEQELAHECEPFLDTVDVGNAISLIAAGLDRQSGISTQFSNVVSFK